MSNVKTGWIWDNALAHGKSVTNWGEQIDSYVDANGKGTPSNSWSKWMHDSQVLDGSGRPITGLYACGNDLHSVMGGEALNWVSP